MIPIVNKDGQELPGHFRSPNGGIVVKNDAQLSRMRAEQERASRLEKLEEDVGSIKKMLQQIINTIDNKD